MSFGRRIFNRFIYTALALSVPGVAFAQAYPTHSIRLVVPFSAGSGGTDLMARLIQPGLSASLGQAIVIDNRPGAGGIPATDIVARAVPDGYTLLMTNVSLAANSYLYSKLPFDPIKDLIPVTMINSAPLLLVVHPTVPARSVKELIAYANSYPGRLNFGSGGVGSTPHLAGELFLSLAAIRAVHVPYKGGAPALNDLVNGQLSFMIENMAGTMPFVKAGMLRALAITSAQRSPLAPDLPTMAESGVPGYEVTGWNGIVAPKGTPPEIVARLHNEVARILRTPEIKQKMAALGAEPSGSSPEEFGAFINAEMVRWGTIIEEKGIRAE
jgi:tripartite-type tricarboxylate transporter receptor subunit TctC